MGAFAKKYWPEICAHVSKCDDELCLQHFAWLRDQVEYSDFIKQASYLNT